MGARSPTHTGSPQAPGRGPHPPGTSRTSAEEYSVNVNKINRENAWVLPVKTPRVLPTSGFSLATSLLRVPVLRASAGFCGPVRR